jgi:hypothetical protein
MARPSKGENAKRRIITMRVTEKDGDRIAAAAEANTRSVSQEIESRLERSLLRDELKGGDHIAAPVELLGSLIALAEQKTGKKWNQDYLTWVAVKSAAIVLFNANRPPHPDDPAICEAERHYMDADERVSRTSPLDAADLSKAIDARNAALSALVKVAAVAKEDAQVGALLASEHLTPLLGLNTRIRG